ncbi:MAG: aspartate 1-decarboxylase [Lentisphaerae bacterium RIFOXYB12_FULL_65_16]|nr:MAG: aspartate 1-decarboxylase [Lentisphaerae bacterium RIFOXYA12_64_32]OGV93177.1 MAG: aspartate 1-decarboxylase [Lentisphaerae bacterium RIFOXYB12_FULL_65_16]
MQLQMLKSKLHRARLTGCDLDYEGSLGIDQDLMDKVGLLPGERILVANQNSGDRLETYAIALPRGSREFCLNGGAARCGMPGDLITVMAFAIVTPQEAKRLKPRVAVLDAENRIAHQK